MEQKYYSKRMNGFYVKSIHGDNMPEDCVKITEEQHQDLLKNGNSLEVIIENDTMSLKEKVLSKDDLLQRCKLKLQNEFEKLEKAKIHNETYDYETESYEIRKKELQDEFIAKRKLFNSLGEKTIDELKVLLKEV